MKKLSVAITILLTIVAVARRVDAATLDDFGGLMSEACPAPKHRVTASCSQSATTETCTITGATITADPNYSSAYDVSVSGMAFIIGIDEPMFIGGTSTAMDWVYVAPNLDFKNGASIITAVNTGTGAITLTAYASNTVSATAGWVEPGRYYDPFSQGTQIGVTPTSAQFTVNDVNGKSTYPICTPEGHRIYVQAVSQACTTSLEVGCGRGNYAISSIGASGGVVTATVNTAENFTPGEYVSVSGVTGTGFNVASVQLQTVNQSTNVVTYNDAGASGSGSGGTMSPFDWVQTGKYSSYAVAATDESAKYKQLGFNTIGEDSDACVTIGAGTCPNINVMPALTPVATTVDSPTIYSSANLSGVISQPIIDFAATLQGAGVYSQSFFNSAGNELDWFNPNFAAFFRTFWGAPGSVESPSYVGNMSDDSDNQQITDGGGLFRGVNNSLTGNGSGQFWNVGAIAAVTSPHQSVSNHAMYGSATPYLYPNTEVYSKTLSGSAPAGCWSASASTTPGGNPVGPSYSACSWPDWARNWYGTVSAMNTAWGSNYTSFGSTETVVTGAAAGTPNGSTTTFNTTLTGHSGSPDITPTTVQIYLKPSGGSAMLIAGDCPAFLVSNGGNGSLNCPSGSAGTGVLIPNTTNNRGFPANTFVETNYTFVDSNNDVEVATSARGQTGGSAPTWPTAPCNGQTTTSGSVTFTCAGPSLTSASTITYTSGALSLTFSSAPASGVTITVSYTWGGWNSGIGTGLEDEAGGGSWVGTNPICVINPPNWQATHTYTAYQAVPVTDPGTGAWMLPITSGTTGSSDPNVSKTVGTKVADGGVTWASIGGPVCAASGAVWNSAINSNQNWAADVTNWAGQLMYAYTNALQTVSHQLWPDLINFGVNFGLQSYDVPNYVPILQAQNANLDAAFSGGLPTPDSYDPMGTQKFLYITNFFNKPIVSETFDLVSSGWDMTQYCATNISAICASSLSARATAFYNMTNNALTLVASSGAIQSAGETWFGNVSYQNQDFGFESRIGNLLDGHENVAGTVTCSAPLGSVNCGNELAGAAWLNQNVITSPQGLQPALSLWLGGGGGGGGGGTGNRSVESGAATTKGSATTQ